MMKNISRFFLAGILLVPGSSYGSKETFHNAISAIKNGCAAVVIGSLAQVGTDLFKRWMEFNADPTPMEEVNNNIQKKTLVLTEAQTRKNEAETKFYEAQTKNVEAQQALDALQRENLRIDTLIKRQHAVIEHWREFKTPDGRELAKRFGLQWNKDNEDLPQLPVEEPKKPAGAVPAPKK